MPVQCADPERRRRGELSAHGWDSIGSQAGRYSIGARADVAPATLRGRRFDINLTAGDAASLAVILLERVSTYDPDAVTVALARVMGGTFGKTYGDALAPHFAR